tara:strand:+ start:71878 stop:72279 length:402 start_codon:yes stop_codon:yes gene_type:complete
MTTVERTISNQVNDVFEDIKQTRNTDYINNFWKDLSHDEKSLEETWSQVKKIMSDGKISYLYKEMIYVAVSIMNNCDYCIHTHTLAARKAGMTDEMYSEFMQVVLLANKTNAMATAMSCEVDERFDVSKRKEV